SLLDLRVVRRIPVDGAGRRVNESLYTGVLCSNQHVDEAVYVDGIRPDRIIHRPRYGSESSVMQDVVDAVARLATCLEIRYVSLDHAQTSARGLGTGQNVVEIRPVAGRKGVEADDG